MARCFVIMPFSKTKGTRSTRYWTNHFEHFLKPTLSQIGGLDVSRSNPLRQDILTDIITHLLFDDIVVADLTDLNPNVLWELGVRQSFKSGTITIGKSGISIPFNLSKKPVLKYRDQSDGIFKRRLVDAANDCLVNRSISDSAVLDTIGGRGTVFQMLRKDEAIRRLDALEAEARYNMNQLQLMGWAKQKGKPERKKLRLRDAALELLVTTRYLDETKEQYDAYMKWFGNINMVNEQLATVEYVRTGTTQWLEAFRHNQYKATATALLMWIQASKAKVMKTM